MKRFFSLVLSFALLLSLAAPVSAAESAAGTTLRLETAEGTVTVKDASGVGKTTRSGMRLYNGYALSTAAASAAYISLDETKAVKLDASAEAEIKKQGKKLEVAVTAGQLFFNVTEPLKTDESLNIRTATMVTGIRGSFGWVNGNQMGLLRGHVTLSCINPETGETRTIDVHSGEMVSYDQASSQSAESSLQEIGFVKETITVEAVPAIAAEEVAKDETLQAQLREDVAAINVTELVESLPEKQAAEKAAEEAALSAVQAAAEAQEQTIAAESSAAGSSQGYADLGGGTAATGDSSDSSSSDDSSGSGGSDSGAPQPVSSVSVSEAAGLGNALNSYNSVTFTGTGTMETLTIPSGKTLTVAPGAELTLTGNISNLSSNTFINNGTVIITGAFDNGSGAGGAAGRFVNNGTLNIRGGGQFINHYNSTFTGNAPAEGSITYQYLVSYNSNGGSAVEAAEYTSGTLLKNVISEANPAKEKYELTGWYTNAELTGKISETDAVTGNLTLYAGWMQTDYKVTLHTDGGTINSGNVTGYTYGAGATLPTDITLPDYAFDGWYDNADCTGTPVTAIAETETGDKTFYAKWTPVASGTYTVQLVIPTGVASVTINEDKTYTASQTLTFPAGTSISMKAVAAEHYTLRYSEEVKATPKDTSTTDTSITFPLEDGSYTVNSNVILTIPDPYYMADASTLSDVLGADGITHIVIGDKADLTSDVPVGKTLLATGGLTITKQSNPVVNHGTIISEEALQISDYFTNNGILVNNGELRNERTMDGSGSIVNSGVLTNLSYLTCGDFTNNGTFNNGSIATDGGSDIQGTTVFQGNVTNRSELNNLNGFVSFSGELVTNNGTINNSSFSEDSSDSSSKKPMSIMKGTTLTNQTKEGSSQAAFHNYGSLTNNGEIVNVAGATFCNYGPAIFTNVKSGENVKVEETLDVNTKATLQGKGTFSGTLLCSMPE